MPGALDNVFGALAKNLIDKFGKSGTFRRRTSTYSASTGKTTAADADTPCVITPPAPFEQRLIDGKTVLMGDCTAMLAAQALALVPTAKTDYIVLDSGEWKVVGAKRVYSGESVCAYELHLRQ